MEANIDGQFQTVARSVDDGFRDAEDSASPLSTLATSPTPATKREHSPSSLSDLNSPDPSQDYSHVHSSGTAPEIVVWTGDVDDEDDEDGSSDREPDDSSVSQSSDE